MLFSSRRLLAAALSCLFSGSALALGEVPDELGLDAETADAAGPVPQLRVERKFNVLAPKPKVAPPVGYTTGQTVNYVTGQVSTFSPPVSLAGAAFLAALDKKPERTEDVYPAFISAIQIEGVNDQLTVAEGEAELRRPNQLLMADKLSYQPLEDEIEAVGHVVMRQLGDEIQAPYMRMRLSDQIGYFTEAQYKISKEVISRFYRPIHAATSTINVSTSTSGAPLMLYVPRGAGLPTTVPGRRVTEGYGSADRIDFEGENHVRMQDATYSTCKPGEVDWFLKSETLSLDYDREEGRAEDATVYFKDIPIFYTPSGSFSLNHQRRTGFLPPNFSASTKNGLDLTTPFYWNLAPSYDLTLYPRAMAKRGVQLGSEARYQDYDYQGAIKFEYMPEDQVVHHHRHGYGIQHVQNLGQGLVASLNLNGVSDDNYWQDFSSRLLQTSQVQLPRHVALNYAPSAWWASNFQVLQYQTLRPGGSIVERPYFIEPQINFAGRLPNGTSDLDVMLNAQYSQFTHPNKVEGRRMVAYPQVSFPIFDPSFSIIPKFGVHATQYALEHTDVGVNASPTRVLPTVSLDATLFLEREIQLMDLDYIQTLEPRLFYVYIPYRDQSKLPVFDSGLTDFNFAQIFNENRYSGYDRVNDANQLTAALTSRFLDSRTGAERFKAMIGQRYYLDQQRVSIPGETARGKDFSNLVAALTGTVLPKTYVDAAWEYDYHRSMSQRISTGMRYQPELAKVVSASYRFARDATTLQGAVEQLDVAAQWPLSGGWYAVGRYNYSVRDKQLLEMIAGLEYNAGCWAARGVVQRLEAVGGSANTTFFFQLELNDFANVGSNPVQLLRRTIPGYGKVNEMPTTGSLLTTQ